MPSRGEAIRIGPFTGGLNLSSDPTSIADNELTVCDNFEIDLDGSLVTRPAITETLTLFTPPTGGTIIGRGSFPGGQNFLIVCSNDANGGVYAYNGSDFQLIDATLRSNVAVQQGGFIWIVPRPGTKATRSGGRWEPILGFVVDANMPEGEAAVFYKSRMFIAPGQTAIINPARLTFTDPIISSTLSWPAANIIDVSPGDGQNLIDLLLYNDNIMLFKNDSTYILAYDSDPADAILRIVNAVIGVSTRYCIQQYENSLFVLHQGKLYEMINFDYEHINLKVPFDFDISFPEGNQNVNRSNSVFLSKLGDRLIIGYFNKIYVFGLKTRTWSTWSSTENFIHCIGPIWEFPTDISDDNLLHVTCSNLQTVGRVYHIKSKPNSEIDSWLNVGVVTPVPIISQMESKIFDFANSHQFKKLFWWGVDVIAPNVTGTVIPYAATTSPLWSSVEGQTWSSLADNTWAQPLSTLGQTTSSPSSEIPLFRVFVKFLKTLRFRMINFKISISHSGSTLDGPVRLFTLTAIVNTKQIVPKQVN